MNDRVAMSVDESVRPLADAVAALLRAAGRAVVEYGDGAALEAAVGDAGVVVELSLRDLLDATAGRDRLTAAALAGVPQVIAPGGLDAALAVVDRVGRDVAHRASAARGPVTLVLPTTGWSVGDGADPLAAERCRVFRESVRLWLAPAVRVIDWPGHLLDAAAVVAAAVADQRIAAAHSGPRAPAPGERVRERGASSVGADHGAPPRPRPPAP